MRNEVTDFQKLSGIQKVAIFLIAVGKETSSSVLRNLEDHEMEQVAVQVAKLRNLPSQVLSAVIYDFYQMMLADKYVKQGGVQHAKSMLDQAFGSEKSMALMKKVKAATEVTGFKLLQSISPNELLNYLQNEHPQTIALILANMKHHQAAGIISELPTEMQGEVAHRLATLGKTAPDLLQEIEDALTAQMGATLGTTFNIGGGVKALAEILNSTSRNVETAIMEVLIQKDPELATEIKNLMFVFEDLISLRDQDIQKVLKSVDSKTLALALKVASEDLAAKIFLNMSQQASEALKEEIEFLGPVRIREVEEAQVNVVEQVREMENRGDITLTRSQEEEFVE
jgi:flagellar motor switch protein FliG